MKANPDIWEQASNRISHKTKLHLQSIYSSLKTAEKKAANFILLHPDTVSENNITEVATLAGCSEATLVRLAKKLSYNGYLELRSSILRQDSEQHALYEGMADGDSHSDIVRKVFRASIQAIEDTLDMLDTGSYEAAMQALYGAKRILLVGSGDAMPVAQSGFLKFSRIRLPVSFAYDYDSQLIQATQLEKGDVLIAISHSGRTRTVMDIVKVAAARKATVVAITNFPVSPLAKHSHIVLITAAFLQNTMGEVMTKRIPELCIIESMYIALARLMRDDAARLLEQSAIALEANKL